MATPAGQARFNVEKQEECRLKAIEIAKRNGRKSELGYVYRLHDLTQHDFDSNCRIELTAYAIQKVTKCGVWVIDPWDKYYYNKPRFIIAPSSGNKRTKYHTTVQMALVAYAHRKRAQLEIGRRTLLTAENALAAIGKSAAHNHAQGRVHIW